jgi:hypothetical protein
MGVAHGLKTFGCALAGVRLLTQEEVDRRQERADAGAVSVPSGAGEAIEVIILRNFEAMQDKLKHHGATLDDLVWDALKECVVRLIRTMKRLVKKWRKRQKDILKKSDVIFEADDEFVSVFNFLHDDELPNVGYTGGAASDFALKIFERKLRDDIQDYIEGWRNDV